MTTVISPQMSAIEDEDYKARSLIDHRGRITPGERGRVSRDDEKPCSIAEAEGIGQSPSRQEANRLDQVMLINSFQQAAAAALASQPTTNKSTRRVSFDDSAVIESWRVLTPERIGLFNGDPGQARHWISQADVIHGMNQQDAQYRSYFLQILPFCLTGLARTWWTNLHHKERATCLAKWPAFKSRLLQDFDEPLEGREKRFHSRRWRHGEEDIGAYFIDKMALCRAAYGEGDDEDAQTRLEMLECKIRQEIRHQAKLDIGWKFEEPTTDFGTMWYLRQIEYQYQTKKRR